MGDCSIKIRLPEKLVKGAGISGGRFLPGWVYRFEIEIKNRGDKEKVVSINTTFGNGLTYLGGLSLQGKDQGIVDKIVIVQPSIEIGNNNLIVFANNIKLSPKSTNKIYFDLGLYDRFTVNSVENSGEKIPHRSFLHITAHVLEDGEIVSDKIVCEAMDCQISMQLNQNKAHTGNETRVYIQCRASQYDLIRKVYIKCILDNGEEYISGSCNLEPNNIYKFNNRTVLKWFYDVVNPMEEIRLSFKIKIKQNYIDGKVIKSGDRLLNSVNVNGVNNFSYTQCPDTSKDYVEIV